MCKHIRALAALGLIKLPKDKPAPSQARARKAHAKTAKAAIAECKALTPEARRHLAAMGPEPGSVRGTDRRAALLGMPKAQDLEIDLAQRAVAVEASPRRPAGTALWEPPHPLDELMPPPPKPLALAAPGSFTAGFRQAVADHLALRRGDLVECAACRYPFDPQAEGSAAAALCGPCLEEQKGGRS
jgi:hypothetical protein